MVGPDSDRTCSTPPPSSNVNDAVHFLVVALQLATFPRSSAPWGTCTRFVPDDAPRAGFASSARTVNDVVAAGMTVRLPVDGTLPSSQSCGPRSARSEARPWTCHWTVVVCPGQTSGGSTENDCTFAEEQANE
jgi:hypothetical protein